MDRFGSFVMPVVAFVVILCPPVLAFLDDRMVRTWGVGAAMQRIARPDGHRDDGWRDVDA